MNEYIICGIQQVGVGVKDVKEAWRWYRKYFGMDCPIFEEEAEAKLMLPYTGGQPRSRHAVLAFNLQSGGGFEIWQYK
jgi:catechol 2,3-dioxygenase-like lactoylglutathione lyase family enzyme